MSKEKTLSASQERRIQKHMKRTRCPALEGDISCGGGLVCRTCGQKI